MYSRQWPFFEKGKLIYCERQDGLEHKSGDLFWGRRVFLCEKRMKNGERKKERREK